MTPVFPLQRGDIVLVPFPFTDLSGQKVRPALIISPDPVGNDILLAFISSVIPTAPQATDYILDTTHPAFPQTGLKAVSVFRMSKLAILHRSLILRRLGSTMPDLQKALDTCLKQAVGL
jgi:mRNA interferase MazF